MRKFFIIIILTSVLITSCSMFEGLAKRDSSSVTVTNVSTATPDPCAPENLVNEIEKIQDLVNTFQDVSYVANFTPHNELIQPIMEMQAIRRELQKLDVPGCEETIKTAAINYMNSTINYLAFFMGGESQENVDAGIQNSQVLWQVVLSEFGKLLSNAGLVTDETPNISKAVPSQPDEGLSVSNNGVQGVNVRSLPNLDASIISTLEPGMQAVGLARNEAGDWIMVNLNGVIGWVFTETVTLSDPIEEFPISEPVE